MTSLQLELPDGYTTLAFEEQMRGACFIQVSSSIPIADRELPPRFPIGFVRFSDPLDILRFDPGEEDQENFITPDGAYDYNKMRQRAGPAVFNIQWKDTEKQTLLSDLDWQTYNVSEMQISYGLDQFSGRAGPDSGPGMAADDHAAKLSVTDISVHLAVEYFRSGLDMDWPEHLPDPSLGITKTSLEDVTKMVYQITIVEFAPSDVIQLLDVYAPPMELALGRIGQRMVESRQAALMLLHGLVEESKMARFIMYSHLLIGRAVVLMYSETMERFIKGADVVGLPLLSTTMPAGPTVEPVRFATLEEPFRCFLCGNVAIGGRRGWSGLDPAAGSLVCIPCSQVALAENSDHATRTHGDKESRLHQWFRSYYRRPVLGGRRIYGALRDDYENLRAQDSRFGYVCGNMVSESTDHTYLYAHSIVCGRTKCF